MIKSSESSPRSEVTADGFAGSLTSSVSLPPPCSRHALTSLDGDQNMFPVYEPDAEVIREKYRAAEEESRAHHYDSTKEGMSNFSSDLYIAELISCS